jgi:hypothetical protein
VSQRHCVAQDALAQGRVQPGLRHQIDAAPEQFLCVEQQSTQRESAGPRRQADQQVHVAVVPSVIARHGPEHPDLDDAVSARQFDQFLAMGFDQGVHDIASKGQQPSRGL